MLSPATPVDPKQGLDIAGYGLHIVEDAHILKFMDSLRRFKAGIFQALANPTRLAILEILRLGELPVTALGTRLGIPQANLSQHLSVLRSRHLVNNRKEGNQVFYSVRDPLLLEVLAIMMRYAKSHLAEDQHLLRELRGEDKLS